MNVVTITAIFALVLAVALILLEHYVVCATRSDERRRKVCSAAYWELVSALAHLRKMHAHSNGLTIENLDYFQRRLVDAMSILSQGLDQ